MEDLNQNTNSKERRVSPERRAVLEPASLEEYTNWILEYMLAGGKPERDRYRNFVGDKYWYRGQEFDPKPNKWDFYIARNSGSTNWGGCGAKSINVILPKGIKVTEKEYTHNTFYSIDNPKGDRPPLYDDVAKRLYELQTERHCQKATAEQYRDWLEGYIVNGGHATLLVNRDYNDEQQIRKRIFTEHDYLKKIFIAKESFKLLPMTGENSLNLIVPAGIEVTYDDLGGNTGHTLYIMEDYSMKGSNNVPIFDGMVINEKNFGKLRRRKPTATNNKEEYVVNEPTKPEPYSWSKDEERAATNEPTKPKTYSWKKDKQ